MNITEAEVILRSTRSAICVCCNWNGFGEV